MKRYVALLVVSVLLISMLFSACSLADLSNLGAKDSDINLLQSIRDGNTEATIEAIKNGANINHLSGNLNEKTDFGTSEKNPFRIACFLGKLNVAQCLISKGANVNYIDSDGNPLLAYTARMSNVKLCQLLLDHGANINETGKNGYTALDYSFEGVTSSNAESDLAISNVVNFLLGHGAKITPKALASALKGYNNDGYCKYNTVQDILKKLIASGQKSGLSSIFEAAILCDSSKVTSLIESSQLTKTDGNKVMFYTAAFGNADTLRLLLEKGLDVNLKDNDGNTLLAIAAKEGNSDILQYLISDHLGFEAQNNDGYTPLELAVANDQYKTSQILLSKGVKIAPNLSLNSSDVMANAAGNGDLNMVKLLFDYGYPKKDAGLAMQAAAQNNQIEILNYFINSGIDSDLEFQDETALGIACSYGNIQVAQDLVEHGASIEGGKIKGTPLNSACTAGQTEIAQYLIEKGANVNAVITYEDGSSNGPVLWSAISSGSLDVVRLLVEHGANVNYKDKNGDTALIEAAGLGSKNIIEYLLQKGANINMQNFQGQTPLIIAASNGYIDNVKILLQYNANTSIKDKSGYTADTTPKSKNSAEIKKLIDAAKKS